MISVSILGLQLDVDSMVSLNYAALEEQVCTCSHTYVVNIRNHLNNCFTYLSIVQHKMDIVDELSSHSLRTDILGCTSKFI